MIWNLYSSAVTGSTSFNRQLFVSHKEITALPRLTSWIGDGNPGIRKTHMGREGNRGGKGREGRERRKGARKGGERTMYYTGTCRPCVEKWTVHLPVWCTPQVPRYLTIMKPPLKLPLSMAADSLRWKCHFTAEIHSWEIVRALNSSSSFGDIILDILNFPS